MAKTKLETLKSEYDRAAAEVTKADLGTAKIKAEIEAKVKAEFKDRIGHIDTLRQQKREAFAAYDAELRSLGTNAAQADAGAVAPAVVVEEQMPEQKAPAKPARHATK